MQALLFRKTGPAGARGTIFASDFAFWELPADGALTYDRDNPELQPVSDFELGQLQEVR